MTRTARRASENLLSSIGSGGLPASNFQAPAEKPNRQASIDRSFTNSAIWLGLSFGTGSLLMVSIAHADPATSTESGLVERLMRVPHQTATGRRARWKSQQDQFSLADRLAARGFSPYGEETQKRSRAGKISSTFPGEDSP